MGSSSTAAKVAGTPASVRKRSDIVDFKRVTGGVRCRIPVLHVAQQNPGPHPLYQAQVFIP